MGPHIEMLSKSYDVTLIANAAEVEVNELLVPNVRFIPVEIKRKISFFHDIKAFIKLCLIFRKERFFSVHSLMPKSGLLAMVAAYLVRVPCRIHTFTGQVWANKIGFDRRLLKYFDKLIVFCSTSILVDSFSQRKFLIDEGVVNLGQANVLGGGSVCGVNTARFVPSEVTRSVVREKLGIPQNAFLFLFVGRLNRDKGVVDLVVAFSRILEYAENVYLLVVGPDEEGLSSELSNIFLSNIDKFRIVDFSDRPEDFMASSDVLCLPSYREGFGSVVIEAAACKVPSIVSCIYGLTDAVDSGKAGLMHPPGDISAIESCMIRMINDEDCRNSMALTAYNRVHNCFSTGYVVSRMREYYENNLTNL
jgi:glycosyltransferase involved in cell wall biosynthesis